MKAKSKKVFSIIKHIILITICIIMIFPFYWMIATAFKDTYAVYEYPPKIFPNPLVVSNFGKVWELLPFGQAFVNSIKIVLTVVVIQLLTASMAAFAFAKLQFKFRELIFLLVLANYRDKELYELLERESPILSGELKRKGNYRKLPVYFKE